MEADMHPYAEALLRWRSEEYGMVPPDQFIPILEKDPLFCELGEWILRTAINGAKLIMEDHPDFIMNIENASDDVLGMIRRVENTK